MIIVAVRITTLPGKRDDLLARSRALVEATRKEPGNVSYGFYSDPENSDSVLIFEQWASRQALDEHSKTAHFLAFIKDAVAFQKGEPQMSVFQVRE